jgi:hypothetical protein
MIKWWGKTAERGWRGALQLDIRARAPLLPR